MLSGLSVSAGFCFIWEHMQSEASGGKKGDNWLHPVCVRKPDDLW